MANFNKVILAGNLTRDPELKYLPSGTPVCEFGLAVNRRWKGQDGSQQESTCFIDCRCFGPRGETINQYMSKGRSILIEGRLDLDQWTANDGSKRSKHSVFVENFQFMDGGRGRGDGGSGGRSASSEGSYSQAGSSGDDSYSSAPGPSANDDIPF